MKRREGKGAEPVDRPKGVGGGQTKKRGNLRDRTGLKGQKGQTRKGRH